MILHLRRPLLAGLVLIIGTNLFIAVGVARNRMGEPDARLTLTERELALPKLWTRRGENSGLALGLRARLNDYRLDRDKLRDLGFDVEASPSDHQASLIYQKMLPRRGFVVLEFEGDSWARWIAEREADIHLIESQLTRGDATQKQLADAREQLRKDRENASRLFVIDVGRDGRALRQRYIDPRRYAIVPGVIRLYYRKTRDEPAWIDGRVSEILVRQIHVPLSWRPIVDEAITERDRRDQRSRRADLTQDPQVEDLRPVYQATLAFGRRFEPALEEVKLLP